MADASILAATVPANAGTQRLCSQESLDSRLRGNDAGGNRYAIHFRSAR